MALGQELVFLFSSTLSSTVFMENFEWCSINGAMKWNIFHKSTKKGVISDVRQNQFAIEKRFSNRTTEDKQAVLKEGAQRFTRDFGASIKQLANE